MQRPRPAMWLLLASERRDLYLAHFQPVGSPWRGSDIARSSMPLAPMDVESALLTLGFEYSIATQNAVCLHMSNDCDLKVLSRPKALFIFTEYS
jgi:hypothetical protein